MSKLKLVEVEWTDSCSPSGWRDQDAFDDYTPDKVRSVGFVVKETRGHITIAAHWSSQQVDGVMCIPKCAVTAKREIKRDEPA